MTHQVLRSCFLLFALMPLLAAAPDMLATAPNATPQEPANWNQAAAARYLDSRQAWWQAWPKSQRDHDTVCVSCHTVLPYALSRHLLHAPLGEQSPAAPEKVLLDNVEKRVKLWDQVSPYYLDATAGPGKSVESRSTESVLNAFVLSINDSRTGQLSDPTRSALNAAWTLQLKSGPKAGAWTWQVFHLAPWESEESQYQGATFMALAVGMAPEQYRNDPSIQPNVQMLKAYLTREYAVQPLENQIVLLWASAKMPGLLTPAESTALVSAIARAQNQDGGWSLARLGAWKRRDGAPQEIESDGYATGLCVLALHEAGIRKDTAQLSKGVAWLVSNQNQEEGSWRGYSVNKNRNLTTDVGRFMSDAATGYAVLALEETR